MSVHYHQLGLLESASLSFLVGVFGNELDVDTFVWFLFIFKFKGFCFGFTDIAMYVVDSMLASA